MASPGVYNVRFSEGREFRAKLDRLAEVLGIEGAVRHMPELLEKALDLALEKKDPQKKLERRQKRQAARSKTRLDEASPPKTRLDELAGVKKREARAGSPLGARASRLHPSRYIPGSVRERLLKRADYQCEYRGPGGVRCTARTRLEIDHIDPMGKGGSHGEENLRVLCRGHNLLAAEGEDRGSKERAERRGVTGRGRAGFVEPA